MATPSPLILADSDTSRIERAAKALKAAGFHVTSSTAATSALDVAKRHPGPVTIIEAHLADGEAGAKSAPSLLDDLASGPKNDNPVLRHITDPITSLWNGPYTSIKLAEEIKRARRFGTALSVVALAFDGAPIADAEVKSASSPRSRASSSANPATSTTSGATTTASSSCSRRRTSAAPP